MTPDAQAGEARFGIMQHDVDVAGIGGVREKESSQGILLEYRFDSPEFLKPIWAPKPYIGGSINLSGNTSHGGAGLAWQKSFTDKFYGEFAFGLSVHNGEERVPNPADAATDLPGATAAEIQAEITRRFERKRDTIEFGSSVLFRNQLAVGYAVSDTWSTELVYEHLSNGTIIGGPENEGLDSLGLRVAYKY